MALSPEDIVNHEFRQALRGYAVQEVDDLLDRLADQVERAERDVADLQQRLAAADARATEALATESTLKRTLITAQDAAQRTIDQAQAHAEKVTLEADEGSAARLDDAGTRCEAMLADAQAEALGIRASYRAEQQAAAARVADLATIEDRYRTQLRSLLESELSDLEDLEAAGEPGGREVAALRADRDAAPAVDPDRGGGDDDALIPFGGLTVRVAPEVDGHAPPPDAGSDEQTPDAAAAARGFNDHDPWQRARGGSGEPEQDRQG